MKTKISRFSRRTVSMVLALLMMVSMLIVGTVSASATTGKFTNGYTIYLDISSVTGWSNDNAVIKAIFYYQDNDNWSYSPGSNAHSDSNIGSKNSLNGGTTATLVATNYYSVTVPAANLGSVRFVRTSGNNIWNYSSRMSVDDKGANNCVKISNWDNTGSWTTYNPTTPLAAPTLKYNNATTTPVNVNANSVNLTWADISNASSYTVFKDGSSYQTNATSPFAVTETGSYTVKAIGTGAYSDSDASNAIQVNLNKTTGIYVKKDLKNKKNSAVVGNAHIWSNSSDNWTGAWPGQAISANWTEVGDYYYKEYTNAYSSFKIIFNKDSNQTNDSDAKDTGKIWVFDSVDTSGDNGKAVGTEAYNITLNVNDGTINAGNIYFYKKDEGATLPTNVTRDGYRFDGWYASSTFDGDPVETIGSSATGNKEYWAKWTATHTVSISSTPSNGTLQISSDGSSWVTSDLTIAEGDSYYVKADPTSGYKIASLTVGGDTIGAATDETEAFTYTGTMSSSNVSVSASFTAVGSCAITAKKTNSSGATLVSENMQIGDELTVYAAGNAFCNHSSYTVSATGSAVSVPSSVDKNTTFTVTAVQPGNSRITISCDDDTSTYFDVNVGTPTVSITSANNADIGGTVLLTATSSGATTTPSYSYDITSGSGATIDGTTLTAGTTAGASMTITVTATYNESYSTTATQTFTVNTPTIESFSYANSSFYIDGTSGNPSVSTSNPNSTGNGWTVTYDITNGSSYASIDGSGVVTGKATTNGTAKSVTVTAYLKYNNVQKATRTATLTVNPPTVAFSSNSAVALNVGGSNTNTATGSNPGNGSISYSGSNQYIDVNESTGAVKGLKPTASAQTVTATYTVTRDTNKTTTVTTSYNVTVNTPVVSCADMTVAVGAHKTLSPSATNTTSPSFSYASDNTSVATVNESGRVVGVAAGTAHITITATEQDWTDSTKVVDVTVEAPELEFNGNDLDGDIVYATVGTNKTYTLTNNFEGGYTVESSDTSVATVSESSGTLTIVPVAKGTATITVSATKAYTRATVDVTKTSEITLKVAAAESTDHIVYFTDPGWGEACVHAWGNSSTQADRASMTKIGQNAYSQDVYAYAFSASDWANIEHMVFIKSKSANWNSNQRTGEVDRAYNAFYTNDSNNPRGTTGYNLTINKPQVVINDATTALGNNYTMTATKVTEANVGEYRWSSGTTGVATVTADTNTTPSTTVVPVDAGTSVVTVKAFAEAPTGWTFDYDSAAALPFIGSTDTATMTVTADDRTVTYSAKASYNHSDYDSHDGEGGTITTSPNVDSGNTVSHGTNVTFTAAASAGYKHVGWRVGTGANEFTTSAKTIRITGDTTVYALFDKIYTLTITNSDAEKGTVSKSSVEVIDGVAPASFTVTPVTGWKIDYANCTNLSTYYTNDDGNAMDTSLTTGEVTFTGVVPAAASRVNTTITIAYVIDNKTVTYGTQSTNNGTDYAADAEAGTISAVTGYSEGTPGSTPTPSSYKLLYTTANGFTALDNNHIDVYKDTTGSKYTAKLTVPTASTNYYFGFSSTTSYTGLVHNNTVTVTKNHSSVTGYGPQNWGGSSHYAYLSVSSANTVVYISFDPASPNAVTLNSSYPNYGGNAVAAVPSNPGTSIGASPASVQAGQTVRFSVDSVASGYEFVGWYRDNVLTSSETVANITVNANMDVYARFKKVYYITLYNSYVDKEGGGFDLIASAPRTVKVGSRTFTYSAGNAAQRGEEGSASPVTASGTYYEGNKIQVIAGEEIKLTYSGLSSSQNITGVFFNNERRYTFDGETDNSYYKRTYKTPAWTAAEATAENGGVADVPDDDWDYDYAVDTTLYADENYYEGANASAITATKANPAYIGAVVNQVQHTVTWTATQNYLNVDLELGDKYKVNINDGNTDGMTIENMNDEGYYYSGETFNAAFKIKLDNSDSSCTYSFNSTTATAEDKDGNTVAGVTLTAKDSSDGTPANAAATTYFLVSGSMPSKDVYITIPIVKTYNMKLANIVVADNVDHKTMLTETSSNSTSNTDSIGTITAMQKRGGEDVRDISDDGTYYTFNNGVNATNNNSGKVEVYTDPSDNNKYLNGGVNKAGTAVQDGDTVTYTFNFNGDNDTKYSFVGWFEGSVDPDDDYKFYPDYSNAKKLSSKTSFTYPPTKNTVVFAVATRDIYLGGSFNNDGEFINGLSGAPGTSGTTWRGNRIRMSFDPTYVNGDNKGRYYYEFEDVTANTEYQFRVYDTVGTGAAGQEVANLVAWTQWSGSDYAENNDDILFGRHKYEAQYGYSHGQFVYKTNTTNWSLIDNTDDTNKSSTENHAANGYGNPVTVYFYAYDGGMSVKSTYQWSTAYVSEGVGVDCTNFEAAAGGTAATFNHPTASVAATTASGATVDVTTQATTYGTDSKGYEKIYKCLVKENNGEIVITANSDSANLELQAFVCYNIDTKESWAVKTFTDNGDNTYTGNVEIPQNSKIYVVPVYKFKASYIETAGLDSHDVFVNTKDIDKNTWGGLVSMYSWGEGKTASGAWPGQLMIPSDDGQSFYAPLTFKAGGLKGVTFSNYVSNGGTTDTQSPTNFLGSYVAAGVSSTEYSGAGSSLRDTTYQAYDYREPISIIENLAAGYYDDDVTLKFALKPGNKGGSTAYSGAYNESYSFEYLTDSKGNRVDLKGETVTGTASYFIVCNYTGGYKEGVETETYAPVPSTRNEFSIDWTVYDDTGTKVIGGSNMLSASYTDIDASTMMSVIASAMIDEDFAVSGKAVKIAYETPKTFSNHVIRYSGQWYNDSVNTPLDVNINVGIIADGVYTPSGRYNPGYATGTVSLVDGVSTIAAVESFDGGNATVVLKHAANSQVKLRVDTTDAFQGWFYYDDVAEEYKLITKEQEFTPSFNSNMEYFAFYSAKASYVFEYTSRDGVTKKTFSVEGYGVTDAELANGGTLDVTARASDIATKLTAKISDIKVFNRNISAVLGAADTSDPYTIKYTATESENTYNVGVYDENESLIGTVSGRFGNKAIDLYTLELGGMAANTNKISTTSGAKVFIGWKKFVEGKAVGDYLSTMPHFGYNVTESMDIIACYGTAEEKTAAQTDTWKSYIDKNVLTKELSGPSTGKIYNDNIIAFRNSAGTQKTLPLDGTKECGIVILAQTGSATAAQKTAFSGRGKSNLAGYANYFRTQENKTGVMNSTNYGEAYAFCIKAESLSDLNRIDLCQILDYAKFGGGQYKVMSYYYDESANNYDGLSVSGYICSEVVSGTY